MAPPSPQEPVIPRGRKVAAGVVRDYLDLVVPVYMVTTDRRGRPVSLFRCPSAEAIDRIDRLERVGWVRTGLRKLIGFDGRALWDPVTEAEAQRIALELGLPVERFDSPESLGTLLDDGSALGVVVVGAGVLGGILLVLAELAGLPSWLALVGLGTISVAVLVVAIDGFRAAKKFGVPWSVAIWRSVKSGFRAIGELLP